VTGHEDDTKTPAQIAASGVSADVRVRAITQSVIALSIIGTMLWLYATTQSAPEGIVGLSGGVVGWYFRGVIAQANGATKP
jgi:hypothetical protein